MRSTLTEKFIQYAAPLKTQEIRYVSAPALFCIGAGLALFSPVLEIAFISSIYIAAGLALFTPIYRIELSEVRRKRQGGSNALVPSRG